MPPTVRVTTEDVTFVLRDTEVIGDTLIAGREGRAPRLVRIEDIQVLEEAHTDVLRTAALIIGVPLAVGFVAIAMAMH